MASVVAFGGILLLLIIPFFIGLIVLQVFLCKRENKGLGLILPIIFLALSLVFVLGSIFMTGGVSVAHIPRMLVVFLLLNIPTIIFAVVYLVCKNDGGKAKQKKQLDRMNIQDLD